MLHKPNLGRPVCLAFIQQRMIFIHNVHCQTQLMLAGAGNGYLSGGNDLCLLFLIAFLHHPLYLIVKKPGLIRLGAIGRADLGVIALGPAICQHLQQGLIALLGHIEFIQLHPLHGIVLGNRIPGIHQGDLDASGAEVIGLAIHFLPSHSHDTVFKEVLAVAILLQPAGI